MEVSNEEKVSNEENKITLEGLKQALESDLEVKGYFDSIVDKTVAKRLEKRLEKAEEQKKLQEEIEKQKKKEIEEIEAIKKENFLLKTQLQFKKILEENEISSEMLPFLATEKTTLEELEANVKSYKHQLEVEVAKEVGRRITVNPPIPEKGEGTYLTSNKLWGK